MAVFVLGTFEFRSFGEFWHFRIVQVLDVRASRFIAFGFFVLGYVVFLCC